MSRLDEVKENNLSFRFWQGAILIVIGWMMKAVFNNIHAGLSLLNILGLGFSIILAFVIFILQGKVNENARKMRDL
jgi:ABC-type Fe3+-siderophore transport system permease subunit